MKPRRALAAGGRATGVVVVFVLASATGAIVHLDLPPVRRIVARRTTEALAGPFRGRVVIERVGELGPGGVGGVDARLEREDGKTVARIEGARARISLGTLARSLASSGALAIALPTVEIDHATVDLEVAGDGTIDLAQAVAPRTPGGGGGRGVLVDLGQVEIEHADVHVARAGAAPVHAGVANLAGAVRAGPSGVAIDVARAEVDVHAGAPPLAGTIEARYASAEGLARVAFDGRVGRVPASARASYEAGAIDAALDVPEARPEDVRALWGGWPITRPVSAHAEAHGTIASVTVAAHAGIGDGAIDVGGDVAAGDATHARAHLDARAIDLRAFAAAAPPSRISAAGEVTLALERDGAARAELSLEVPEAEVASVALPPATVRAEATRASGASDVAVTAKIAGREPGAPFAIEARTVVGNDLPRIAFEATATAPDLRAIPRTGPIARGHARAAARGTIDLAERTLDASIDASAGDLAHGAVRAREATLSARARGPLSSPEISADLLGRDLEMAGLRFWRVQAHADGPPTAGEGANVTASLWGNEADVRARARVAIGGGVALRGLDADLLVRGERAQLRAARVEVAGDRVRVDDAEVLGLGAPLRASGTYAPGALDARARCDGLDVDRLARVLGRDEVRGGRLALDVDAAVRADGGKARMMVDFDHGTIAGLGATTAHVDVRLEGRRLWGRATAQVTGVGTLDVRSPSLEVAGAGPLSPSSWRRAWGTVEADAHVDLAKLVAALPERARPRVEIGGVVDVSARAGRDTEGDATPDVSVVAVTTGLTAQVPTSGAPLRIAGVDGSVRVHADGATGVTDVAGEAHDASGALATLRASSREVPWAKLAQQGARPAELLARVPFDAQLLVPARDLASLPAFFGTAHEKGELEATVDWHGPAAKPAVDARASLRHGRVEKSVLALPVDFDLHAVYDGAVIDADLVATTRARPVLRAHGEVGVRAEDVLDGGGPPAWSASATAQLAGFPLQSVGPLYDKQIRGRASGELAIARLHDDAYARASLAVEKLTVGDVECRAAYVQASLDGNALDATAHIDHGDGSATALAHVGTRWGAALAPSIDPSKPAKVELVASNLRAGLLLPFAGDAVSELDGRIDARVAADLDPAADSLRPSGTIALREGTVELPSAGGELHDATARVTFTPDGVVRIDEASARGLSGRVGASGLLRVDRHGLVAARAHVEVPENDPLPLVVSGTQVGSVRGAMDLSAQRAADRSRLDVRVDVPSMRLDLPLTPPQDVQALGDLEGVRFAVRGPGGAMRAVRLDGPRAPVRRRVHATPIAIAVHLGSGVEIRRGNTLDVRLEGEPSVVLADGVRASGQVHLTRGTLEVQGKPFEIENGTVSFVGDDVSNPQVVLTAGWTAPDGTHVYADFVGPLKTGTVRLRSEPARSKDEILALILFGTTDQQQAPGSTGSSPQGTAAVGAAGGAATAPINQALGGVNRALDSFGLAGGITTKVDTSQANPRPEVEIQIARDVTVQIAWVLGIPPPGSNPDTALAILNWRFSRAWSLETTVGDAGTSILDLVWQHRY